MLRKKLLVIGVAGLTAASGLTAWAMPGLVSPHYTLRLVIPSAAGIYDGSQVQISGLPAGKVSDLTAQDGKAVVTVSLDDAHAPLHAGTKATITFRSVLGEAYIRLQPGSARNPALPSGSMIDSGWSEVTVDDLLQALDPATRTHLDSLVQQLQATLAGRQQDLGATVRTAGPTVQALGQVLDAVGSDGPAIRGLVTNLQHVAGVLATRQTRLSRTVRNLSTLTGEVAGQQRQLTSALQELPTTLRSARGTLDQVPAAADAATPLLKDLTPATAALGTAARNLSPLLADLRPAVAELKPAAESAQTLLRYTPGLLDSAHDVLPGVTQAATSLGPALTFLRPYTPDILGWADNWGNSFAKYDAQGHYGAALLYTSASELDNSPLPNLPTLQTDHSPPPGLAANQPWTDANGDPMR